MTKIWARWVKYFDDFLNLFTKINSKWDKNAMKKGFLPKIIKTYLHQLRQYSNVFCKNMRKQTAVSKNAKFICHTVTKTKECHILRNSIDEVQSFSGWK